MKKYTTPTFDKLALQTEDIITASNWGFGTILNWDWNDNSPTDIPEE